MIAEAMTQITGEAYTYLDDSVWSVNGDMHDNIKERINNTEISTKSLIDICNKYSDHTVWRTTSPTAIMYYKH